jgi:hypothetical protein
VGTWRARTPGLGLDLGCWGHKAGKQPTQDPDQLWNVKKVLVTSVESSLGEDGFEAHYRQQLDPTRREPRGTFMAHSE